MYDILIIGAGPIGLNCALEARRAGLSSIIIEKGTTVNSIYRYPLYMKFFSTADKLEIGNVPFITSEIKPGRREALEYYQGIARQNHLDIHHYEKVLAVARHGHFFKVQTTKAQYSAANVVIATGFYDIPNRMNVPGETLAKVQHYYTEPYPYAGQRVVVVGASNSAVDAALETYRKGAEVTMVIRSNKISDSVKYWVKPDIENRIAEGSIRAFFNSEIESIAEDSVMIRDHTGTVHRLGNDFVLAMTGYLPDFDFLKSMGITLHSENLKPSYNPDTMESEVPGLYMAGVVCGGRDTHLWFIENSRVHAERIIKAVTGGRGN